MSKEYSQGTGAPGMLRMRSLLYLVLLGCASSLLLNGLASLFQLPQLDAGYQRAQESLYAVPLWQGLLYYGLLFPIGEELVFRGIGMWLLTRFLRLPGWWCIAVTALLFGIYHGNLLQGSYAFIMGLLLGWIYVHSGRQILYPILLHAISNLVIYSLSFHEDWYRSLTSVPMLCLWGILCVWGIWRWKRGDEATCRLNEF